MLFIATWGEVNGDNLIENSSFERCNGSGEARLVLLDRKELRGVVEMDYGGGYKLCN